MSTNEKFRDGDQLNLPVPSGTVSGQALLLGSVPCVALTTRDAAGNATVTLKGVHRLSVAGAVTQILSPIYITSGGALTTTPTSNTLFGYAASLKSSGTAVMDVLVSRA